MLFIIYINDITDVHLSDASMTIYADDIMLYQPMHAYISRLVVRCSFLLWAPATSSTKLKSILLFQPSFFQW